MLVSSSSQTREMDLQKRTKQMEMKLAAQVKVIIYAQSAMEAALKENRGPNVLTQNISDHMDSLYGLRPMF